MNENKLICKLSDENGNIFNLSAIASKKLKRCGKYKEQEEMTERILKADTYEEALAIIGVYVEII